ncbi:SusC/RagA family TonB-linked outer membrane protein [Ancylomarina longa]|uniref:SusC/RagA family TonB-linked outer membrane protein n=1 Tax=Ancylomarina longa TaxID=2487017 RepID=A0A434ATT9_9BACT|nr:SusC/RagA family TonB-linked outer membrane protein [Ancylomarina longa]RUT77846.1 SusC/RagA family TonB-linked outer membrane protein [Ancylomarina longa]
MKKMIGLFVFLIFMGLQIVNAQSKQITGTVTSADDGLGMPGVSVVLKGTTIGASTDIDGKYSLEAKSSDVLMFSFVGMVSQEIAVGNKTVINAVLETESIGVDEVVVTALGITRKKKALGYSVTDLGGDDVTKVKQQNLVSSLSGKVAGVQIKQSNNFGGSTNMTIRGNSSIYGGNQPLFVVDGVPVGGGTFNSAAQRGGSTGYDYGNALSDINPDDIANMSVLKGAAATAIYGSRGANGVVMITTKKGTKRKGVGISVNSGITIGKIDKDTFAKYQKEYGGGYGPYYGSTGYFEDIDVDGDGTLDLAVPNYDDASYGAKFDGTSVYQWDSFVPESPNYLKKYEYKGAEHDPVDFFETEVGYSNNVEFTGGNDQGNFRLSYTNFHTNGVLPNSKLNRNTIAFNGDYKINEKLKVGVSANTSFQYTKGRNSTGYSDNIMSSMRQWWQVNTDVKAQESIYKQTRKNYTWNNTSTIGGDAVTGLYWDNPYWSRFENYETDNRDRIFGNAYFNLEATDWMNVTGRVSIDTYNTLREERRAVGSVAAPFGLLRADEGSGYQRSEISFKEINYDLMANYHFDLNEDFALAGLVGFNMRDEATGQYYASTLGGLVVPDLYSLSNSVVTPSAPVETLRRKRVYGLYAQATFSYKDLVYLDLTDRVDKSSSLPTSENTYNYYSAAASYLFSSQLELPWLNLGKLRMSYATVGNDTDALNVNDTFTKLDNFGTYTLFSFPSTKNNKDLKSELSSEFETGLETKMFNNRLGVDVSYYYKKTKDMLIPVEVSKATGYSFRWVNAATVENKGFEVAVYGAPVKTKDFSWEISANWARNRNKVLDLFSGVDNIVINSYQGGISINATKGEALGTIRGTGFVFDENGNKVINSSGYYKSQSDQVIGNQNPDWTGGVTNTLSYKGLTLSFLIDVQQGGDVYSLDMHYGQGTGVLAHTAGLNELGNPKRDPVADGGGILNVGVTEDGAVNTTRARADFYGGAYYWGNSSRNPAALTVYDASFVKLREMSLTYNLPKKLVSGFANNVSLSLVGRNLWIISKHVPYADPESGLSAGLAQGYLSGSYPTVRSFGFNVKVDF